ncbi:MAG: hypothetical protein DRN13_03105 [Thermoplasmata archaeon]|nr:MAG: hypothetical protein DRN13_03105 [Thermoplasmata archaeon]
MSIHPDKLNEYRKLIFRIAISYLKNHHDAEDITQEVILKALRMIQDDRAISPGWLAKTTANLCVDKIRLRKRTVRIDDLSISAHYPSPEDEILARETREMLERAMADLRDDEKEILWERFVDGRSYEELQRKHGLSYSALTSRIYRAKDKLRRKMNELINRINSVFTLLRFSPVMTAKVATLTIFIFLTMISQKGSVTTTPFEGFTISSEGRGSETAYTLESDTRGGDIKRGTNVNKAEDEKLRELIDELVEMIPTTEERGGNSDKSLRGSIIEPQDMGATTVYPADTVYRGRMESGEDIYFELKGYKFLKVHPVYHRELVEVAEAYDGTLIPVYKGVKTVVPIICTRKIDPQKAAKTIDMYESLLQSDKYTPEQKEKIWEDYLITLKHYEEVMANPEKLKGYSTSEPHGDIIDPVLSYPTWDTQRIREYLIESGIMIPPDE